MFQPQFEAWIFMRVKQDGCSVDVHTTLLLHSRARQWLLDEGHIYEGNVRFDWNISKGHQGK